MTRVFIALTCLVLAAPPLQAQTATATSSFAWDQAAPDLATAQGYTYQVYADGAATGTRLTASCSGSASPFLCTAPVGAYTPGSHSVTFTASNAAGESARSAAVSFTMVLVPTVPANPRVQ